MCKVINRTQAPAFPVSYTADKPDPDLCLLSNPLTNPNPVEDLFDFPESEANDGSVWMSEQAGLRNIGQESSPLSRGLGHVRAVGQAIEVLHCCGYYAVQLVSVA